MAYVKVPAPSVVYHLTKADRLDRILDDGKIRRFGDSECWFCESLPKMKAYMEQTVLCEEKPYYAVGGQLCRYPKFVPEDYVLLKLKPHGLENNWYRWEQEVPPGSPKTLIRAAREFSALKIGYRGDLAFHNAEIIDKYDKDFDSADDCFQAFAGVNEAQSKAFFEFLSRKDVSEINAT